MNSLMPILNSFKLPSKLAGYKLFKATNVGFFFSREKNVSYFLKYFIEYYLRQCKWNLNIGAHDTKDKRYLESLGKKVLRLGKAYE
jgi:hypothetical protein